MISKKSYLILFILMLGSAVFSTAAELTKIKARALPDKITLGGETRLFIETDVPQGSQIEIPSRETNLFPFEIKMAEELLSVERSGRKVQKFALTLTVFQLGELIIPPVPLIYRDAGGRKERVMTQSVKIKVVSVPKRSGDGKDIRPIKGPVSLDAGFLRSLILGSIAFILFTGLCLKVYLRKRNAAIKDLESLKPPYERLQLELGRLLKKNFIEEKKTKEFYSELADILRRYLERRLEVEALESTTPEIVQRLKKKGCDAGIILRIKNILENSDLVKFAKFVPSPSLADTLIEDIRAVAELTKPAEDTSKKGAGKK